MFLIRRRIKETVHRVIENFANKSKSDKKPPLFFSFDVEADGICPGISNMLSLGVACFDEQKRLIATFKRNIFEQDEFTQEPNTMKWWESNKEAWDYCHTDQVVVKNAMDDFVIFINDLKKKYEILPIAWPINYDWMWIHYYLCRYTGSNPLGSSARCVATYAWAIRGIPVPLVKDKMKLDKYMDPQYPHSHKALDDAKEQGAMFMNMWRERQDSITIIEKIVDPDFYQSIIDRVYEWSKLDYSDLGY